MFLGEGGKRQPAHWADNLTTFMRPNVSKSGRLNLLDSCGPPVKGLYRDCSTFARSMEPSPS